MASGGRRGAGERVLESKHVIGLFLLMLVFSGVFFSLGYVMGRNQYDGQVRAASNGMNSRPESPAAPVSSKPLNAKEVAPASPAPHSAVARTTTAPLVPNGAVVLQVAALAKQDDALALASSLQKKHFSAYVQTPQKDKFYRVQVGPFHDSRSAEAAKKGLESAGFKAFYVKH